MIAAMGGGGGGVSYNGLLTLKFTNKKLVHKNLQKSTWLRKGGKKMTLQKVRRAIVLRDIKIQRRRRQRECQKRQ